MTLEDWQELVAIVNDEVYEDLVGTAECGPFDGCCVLVAEAIRQVFGGEVYVVVDRSGRADHAAVFLDGLLWDYEGPREPTIFLAEFNDREFLRGDRACVTYRPIADGDLSKAVRDDHLRDRIAELFSSAVHTCTRHVALR